MTAYGLLSIFRESGEVAAPRNAASTVAHQHGPGRSLDPSPGGSRAPGRLTPNTRSRSGVTHATTARVGCEPPRRKPGRRRTSPSPEAAVLIAEVIEVRVARRESFPFEVTSQTASAGLAQGRQRLEQHAVDDAEHRGGAPMPSASVDTMTPSPAFFSRRAPSSEVLQQAAHVVPSRGRRCRTASATLHAESRPAPPRAGQAPNHGSLDGDEGRKCPPPAGRSRDAAPHGPAGGACPFSVPFVPVA